MPESSPFLLLILFFGVSWLRKKIKLIKTMTGNQARPIPPPSPFQEAAPMTAKRTVPLSKPAPQVPKPSEPQKRSLERGLDQVIEGQRLMGEPSWNEVTEEKYKPAKPAAAQKARPTIVPHFTSSALVQAVVTKEILTRPRSAWRPNHS